MDPELKKQLDEIHALAKDNHDMLHKMRRDQMIGYVAKVVIWLIVFILPLYLYQQYLQPFVKRFSEASGVTTSGPFGFPSSAELQKLLNAFKSGTATQ